MLSVVVAGIVGAAAVVTALGVLARFTGLGAVWKDFRDFLKDWKGEPPREGFAGRPSFPARMTAQEVKTDTIDKRTADLNHEMRGELSSRMIMLEEATAQLKRNGGTSVADVVHRIEEALTGLTADVGELKAETAENRAVALRVDERVTEHRRRQDEAVASLREYLTQRLNAMEISQAQFEAMRASLHELGIDMEPPEVGRG